MLSTMQDFIPSSEVNRDNCVLKGKMLRAVLCLSPEDRKPTALQLSFAAPRSVCSIRANKFSGIYIVSRVLLSSFRSRIMCSDVLQSLPPQRFYLTIQLFTFPSQLKFIQRSQLHLDLVS